MGDAQQPTAQRRRTPPLLPLVFGFLAILVVFKITEPSLDGVEERLEQLEEQLGLNPSVANARERVAALEGLIGKAPKELALDGSRLPTTITSNGSFKALPLLRRLRYLERKVDYSINWLKDPLVFREVQHICSNVTDLGTDDYHVCLDGWRGRHTVDGKDGSVGCLVYDIGIRANPRFGHEMLTQFGCTVRAYDPSSISKSWWKGTYRGLNSEGKRQWSQLKAAGKEKKYTFFPYGAGGTDGPFKLFEYSWGQASIYLPERDLTLYPQGEPVPDVPPRELKVEAKTLPTMMRDNGDSYIDVMKIDIEGSEFMFLQDIFDRMGCPPVGQITLEWHHFSIDERYGSPAEVNAIFSMLRSCGFKCFYNRPHWRAVVDDLPDPQSTDHANRQIPPMRYAVSAFCKDC